ncbi:hypothetical protein FMM05_20295 [Flavobacterium zepuense]|uniref:Uncharacterized protein n=1 Tax=Flavobacterium zepuense TaxID=2593302 RepID=A0A552UTE1_9FLAO|nr:hypothetical protein [Flavobacterium zepuense]TRW21493.1 hypothetical protein FMM05_20295 [Flavobacterium zepuense]
MADQYQLKSLADTVSAAAFAINKRIKDEIQQLSFEEVQALSNESRDLLIAGKTLYELTAIEIAKSGKDSLKKLEDATDTINKAIKTIKTVQTVINITAKLVVLAGSIFAGNYTAIPQNVSDIISLLSPAEEEG